MEPIEKIRELHEITNITMIECRNILRQCDYDMDKAKELSKEFQVLTIYDYNKERTKY